MEVFSESLMEYVISIVVIVIGAIVSYFAPKVKHWIKKKSDKDDLGIIDAISDRTVEFVENEFFGEDGEAKFLEASEQIAKMLNSYGIEASDDLIQRSVQQAWRVMNDKQELDDEDMDEDFLDELAEGIEEDVEDADEEKSDDGDEKDKKDKK